VGELYGYQGLPKGSVLAGSEKAVLARVGSLHDTPAEQECSTKLTLQRSDEFTHPFVAIQYGSVTDKDGIRQ